MTASGEAVYTASPLLFVMQYQELYTDHACKTNRIKKDASFLLRILIIYI